MDMIRTLGLFDSGQGGLGTWNMVRTRFPHLNTIYLGDNARYPYGTKSNATVRRYTTEAILALTEQGAEGIIVACGTASCVAVPSLTRLFRKPVLGIVDGMCEQTAYVLAGVHSLRETHPHTGATRQKEANQSPVLKNEPTPNLTVAVLGTPYSVSSGRIDEGLAPSLNATQGAHLWKRACPLFVSLVEEGVQHTPIGEAVITHYLHDLPLDTRVILLACTHFPHMTAPLCRFLRQHLSREVLVYEGPHIPLRSDCTYLIDPALAMAESLPRHLLVDSNHANTTESSKHRILCTDDPDSFHRTGQSYCTVTLPQVEKFNLGL
jgi:glutamate racemase